MTRRLRLVALSRVALAERGVSTVSMSIQSLKRLRSVLELRELNQIHLPSILRRDSQWDWEVDVLQQI